MEEDFVLKLLLKFNFEVSINIQDKTGKYLILWLINYSSFKIISIPNKEGFWIKLDIFITIKLSLS